jgi:hypothetical protein
MGLKMTSVEKQLSSLVSKTISRSYYDKEISVAVPIYDALTIRIMTIYRIIVA